MNKTTPRSADRLPVYRFMSTSLLTLFLYGCSGGLSCGSDAEQGCVNGYDYPQSQLENGIIEVQDGTEMRLTQGALDFLDGALKDILISTLGQSMTDPDNITLELPPTQLVGDGGGIGDVALGEGEQETYPTSLLIDASEFSDKIQLRLIEAGEVVVLNGEQVTVQQDGILLDVIGLPVGIDARIFTRVGNSFAGINFQATAGCDLDGTNPDFCPPDNPECGILTSLDLGVLIYPRVGEGAECDLMMGECLRIEVDVVHADISGIDSGDLDISVPPNDDDDCGPGAPPLCSPECSDQNTAEDLVGLSADWECNLICAIEEFTIDLLVNLIGFIEPLIDSFFDELLTNAIQDALADFDGAPISVATTVDVADLLNNLIPGDAAEVGYAFTPTGDAFQVDCPAGANCETAKGMDFVLNTGLEAAPNGETPIPHPCVAATDAQAFQMLFGGTEFEAGAPIPLDGTFNNEPYHFGASVSRATLQQSVFGMYNAGGLCIEASSDSVYQLTDGAFPFSVGTVDLLVEGKLRNFAAPEAPALVALTPHEPPVLTLGAGTEEEGHIQIQWNDVEVSFYALAYERFARVFSVQADLMIEASVLRDPETDTLNFSIVSGPDVANIREVHNELLPEVDFIAVLESLTAVALDAALGDGFSFPLDFDDAIGEALGTDLELTFNGIETLPQPSPEFLRFYATFATPTEMQMRAAPPLPLRVFSSHVAAQPQELQLDLLRRRRIPGDKVELVSDRNIPDGTEFFVQVGFGMYRGPYQTNEDGRIEIQDARLRLGDSHKLKIRHRPKGFPEELSWPPAIVHVNRGASGQLEGVLPQ